MRTIMHGCARRKTITGGLVVALSIANTCAAQRKLPPAAEQHPLLAQSTGTSASDGQPATGFTGPNGPGKPGGIRGREATSGTSGASAPSEPAGVPGMAGEAGANPPATEANATSAGWGTSAPITVDQPRGMIAGAPVVHETSPSDRARVDAAKAGMDARAAAEQATKAAQDAAKAVEKNK